MVSVKTLIHRINEIESKQGSGGEGKFLKNVLLLPALSIHTSRLYVHTSITVSTFQ